MWRNVIKYGFIIDGRQLCCFNFHNFMLCRNKYLVHFIDVNTTLFPQGKTMGILNPQRSCIYVHMTHPYKTHCMRGDSDWLAFSDLQGKEAIGKPSGLQNCGCTDREYWCSVIFGWNLVAVSIRKTVLPGMAIPMLKIRRPNGRLIFNMEIAIRR